MLRTQLVECEGIWVASLLQFQAFKKMPLLLCLTLPICKTGIVAVTIVMVVRNYSITLKNSLRSLSWWLPGGLWWRACNITDTGFALLSSVISLVVLVALLWLTNVHWDMYQSKYKYNRAGWEWVKGSGCKTSFQWEGLILCRQGAVALEVSFCFQHFTGNEKINKNWRFCDQPCSLV